jgi:hypothetical protein
MVLSMSVLMTQVPAQAQTNCTAFNACAFLQGEQNTKLTGTSNNAPSVSL